MTMIRRSFAVALAAAVVLGCSSEPKKLKVTGAVTFKGAPVGEGTIQFTGKAPGTGGETNLKPDGTYDVELLPGRYSIIVYPKFEVDTMKGLPNPKWGKSDNIPNKYHQPATSDLACDVAPDKVKHDFDLKP
jgi:hypothetical protein